MLQTVHQAWFSPTRGTEKIVLALAASFGVPTRTHDLLLPEAAAPVLCGPDDLLVVGVPVFVGRVPAVALDRLARFQSRDTPAIAVVAYGNRDYEDALLELCDALEARHFKLLGAGAFIARHSVFPALAEGRPDAADHAAITAFGQACGRKLAACGGVLPPLAVPGKRPYREVPPGGHKPVVTEACSCCGLCPSRCPTSALRIVASSDAPPRLERDADRCIACAACVTACPVGAHRFQGPAYDKMAALFVEKFSARREPETFLGDRG